MVSWYLPAASSFAPDVDHLIFLIAVIVGAWLIAAEVILFWFVFAFRARDGRRAEYIAGEDAREKRWVSHPHHAVLVFDVIIVVAALLVWHNMKLTLPDTAAPIRVIGQQWSWTFVQPGPDGRLDTADDIRTVDDLNVQVGRPYVFELHSRDVVHSFSVPAFRFMQDSMPGRVIYGWFTPTAVGTFDIQCAQICGIGHAMMAAKIHVRTGEDHQAWMREAQARAVATDVPARAPASDPARPAPSPTAGMEP
jgi:cytochrome c oxidase subunit II